MKNYKLLLVLSILFFSCENEIKDNIDNSIKSVNFKIDPPLKNETQFVQVFDIDN